MAFIAIWIPDILLFFKLNLETGDLQDLKYGVFRIIGSGSVSFTMSSGGQDDYSFIPRWNKEAATMESASETLRVFHEEGRETHVWSSTSLHV